MPRQLQPDEVPVAVTYLSGTLPRMGVGWASLRDLPAPAQPPPTLEVLDVADAFSAHRSGGRDPVRRLRASTSSTPSSGAQRSASSGSCER